MAAVAGSKISQHIVIEPKCIDVLLSNESEVPNHPSSFMGKSTTWPGAAEPLRAPP
jgi:hypothetical protein